MPGLRQNLLHGQVLAVQLVRIVPVLLLALSGAVVNPLAPGTLLNGGLILWLLPAIAAAVEANLLSCLRHHCGHSDNYLKNDLMIIFS